jgi:hypothetical protein
MSGSGNGRALPVGAEDAHLGVAAVDVDGGEAAGDRDDDVDHELSGGDERGAGVDRLSGADPDHGAARRAPFGDDGEDVADERRVGRGTAPDPGRGSRHLFERAAAAANVDRGGDAVTIGDDRSEGAAVARRQQMVLGLRRQTAPEDVCVTRRIAADDVVYEHDRVLRVRAVGVARQCGVREALAVGVPGERDRRRAAADVRQRIGQHRPRSQVQQVQAFVFAAALLRRERDPRAVGRKVDRFDRRRRPSCGRSRIEQHPLRRSGAVTRDQDRLRRRRRAAQVHPMAPRDLQAAARRRALGERFDARPNPRVRRLSVDEAGCQLGFGRCPRARRRRARVFEPAIRVGDGRPEVRVRDRLRLGRRVRQALRCSGTEQHGGR